MARTRDESSPLFAGNAAGTLRLIFYLALALVLMVLDHRNGWLWRLRYGAATVVEPIYKLAGLPAVGVRTLSVAFADRQRLTEQNQRLREDLLLANAKLNRMASVAEQNQRLKELLDTQHSLELNVQLARVVGVDLGSYSYRMTLDLGARDGVKPGQPVIDAHGVIGQIREVLPTTSVVMLVTDPAHAIPVVIERSGLRTVAYGSRDGSQLTLPNIPLAADVRVGDHLLTSGLGGRFPPGFPVGDIRSVAPAATGMFQQAQAQPSADINRSVDVLLLHDQAEPDGPPLPVKPMGPPADLAPTPGDSSTAVPGSAGKPPAKPAETYRCRGWNAAMNRQRLTLWCFIGTLVFALLSMLVPLPDVLEPFKPYWPALFLLYWALESEDRVTLGLAFAIGLGADLLDGVVLGEQALRLCALVFIAMRFRSRLRFFPMWQQTLAVLALLLNDRLLLLIVRLLAGASLPPASWWISPFVGAALWPFLFLLLDDLRARLRIQ